MGCFCYFRERTKFQRQEKCEPRSIELAATLNTETGGLDCSVVPKQLSKSSDSTRSHRSLPSLYEERAHCLRVFELKELKNATSDFSRLLKIGEGGFGIVYKGFIKPSNGKGDKIAVAVKKLSQNGLQGHKQWLAEVQFLGVVEHPNLVKLIGYCAVDGERGTQRLLVYEFIPNKSLEFHLFNKAYPSLPWNTRLQIALGAAEGLRYLHEGLDVQVIYRDFKTSNVLLDEAFKPKLSDFGLAREGPSAGDTHVSTAVMGTHGYAAPDYIETGHLTSKSDVWSYGVVLYEILTGRRSLEKNRPKYEQKLLVWVKHHPVDSRRFIKIIDPRLENKYSLRAAREIAKLANSCLSRLAKDRPKMSEVIESIKRAMQYTDLDGAVEQVEEHPARILDNCDKVDWVTGNELFKKRMLHLAELGGSSKMIGRRKSVVMTAASPS